MNEWLPCSRAEVLTAVKGLCVEASHRHVMYRGGGMGGGQSGNVGGGASSDL